MGVELRAYGTMPLLNLKKVKKYFTIGKVCVGGCGEERETEREYEIGREEAEMKSNTLLSRLGITSRKRRQMFFVAFT